MWAGVVTLFPEMFTALTEHGVTGRAVKRGQLTVEFSNPREHAHDRHRTVDDRPFGGGPGMLMKVEPLLEAIEAIRQKAPSSPRVIYLSPQGQPLTQQRAEELAQLDSLVLLCGRYEGIDERIVETCVDEEISIGDYVLSGGELGAMVLLDAVTRLIPGVLGHVDSAAEDSFSEGWLDCPHYTRPEEFAGQRVPEVLLSGNHALIRRWRLKQSLGRTWQRRPELLAELTLSKEQQQLLAEYIREQETDNH
ncbi:tRNA (guanosine(37)-N1)-methyltransferase TrmD [Pseudomonas sp. G11-1]|uniref:tRNA (guanine-N(1)-)-methyltransferase n=1 Tax=Halopseudomonas bauzanensis TaxID=653930 RepID=A0A4U0YSN2_9GAMM|nr:MULTISPECIES: tRNA (guanosine(37)-N1)-methyltransferase TrmD [Halopseudomonas]MCO5787181.1 tRNA (guanosine(37)-N1)-methyltransferase TrmD [Pseudomonas sp. G11-1]MCO5790407.1 tRNA (guanosine(37)-N1)-methyltransferase TrmD [Pseudomonas sp. G11-2]EZQ18834.1 tRNA (guanine-N1)-methyltransferase [Halopseudomonas bauzanensis]TKA92083.1 tRNA (guanosine(37)-N1)-methyltransferase TrmD [Halopseudomonas bauzanensis]WGK62335.1 tRNA (guanosine(37)-N1)-methyltransferase TrmD [Halopseudomonas sp. SMJS2]